MRHRRRRRPSGWWRPSRRGRPCQAGQGRRTDATGKGAKLGGKPGKVYIVLMRADLRPQPWMPLLAAAALAWPHMAGAQAFSADYDISRAVIPGAESAAERSSAFSLGNVHIGAAFQADPAFSGAGLSLEAGRNWFAQVSIGRSIQQAPGLPSNDAVRIGGGYRWSDGQSLSLHLTSGRGPDRLGLSVSYDWPRYFVRLGYDGVLTPAQQDKLRFSAGVRF